MSQEYEGQDPIDIAKQAERDLNSNWANQENRRGASDSTLNSGVDESVESRFAGAEVNTGPQITGREIPEDQGGVNPDTGKPFKADDFEGEGGPEDKAATYAEEKPGDDSVRQNIR